MNWLVFCCFLSGWGPPTVATDTLYGTYVLAEAQLNLKLSPPNNYTLFVMQYNDQSEAVTSQELSRGSFEMQQDVLVLEDITNGKAMKLEVTSEEKLQPLNVPGLDDDLLFLGHNQYYPNGELKWEGEWRKGKKHGRWVYYDEEGNLIKAIRYKRGKKQE